MKTKACVGMAVVVVVLSGMVAGLSYRVACLAQDLDDAHRRINVVQAYTTENDLRLDAIENADES